MRILFTKSAKIGSKLIRWGLKEPCSHVAFEFDNKLIIHSSLHGVELQWANTFLKNNSVVFEYEILLPLADEEQVYQGILDAYDDCDYDYGAYFYFACCIFKHRLFGKPMPTKNEWAGDKKFLCTEMVKTLPKWLVDFTGKDLAIVSPYQLYLELTKLKPTKTIEGKPC